MRRVEFQTEGRSDVPERMARFQLLAASSKEVRERGARLASFVVYLDKLTYREDPGRFEIAAAKGTSLVATYTVVRLWEEDPRRILEMSSPGLCPFVPLMRGEPKELFVESRKKIESASEATLPASTRRTLLAVMAVLAERVIKDTDYLRRCLTEVRAMGENWVIDELMREGKEIGLEQGRREGREEGRKEGLVEGRVEGLTEAARRAVVRVLERRFGEVAAEVRARVNGVAALERLELLHDEAVTCANLDAFLGFLGSD